MAIPAGLSFCILQKLTVEQRRGILPRTFDTFVRTTRARMRAGEPGKLRLRGSRPTPGSPFPLSLFAA